MEIAEETVMKEIARLAYKHCREYLKDPAHMREFEAWYFKRYGKKYVWKTQSNNI